MKNLTLIAAVAFIALAFTACKKEPGVDNTYSIPNGVLLTSFYSNQLSSNTQTFVVDATDGGTVTAANGMTVTIAPASLYYNQTTVVTGNVTVTLVEVYDRGRMATMNKATMGYVPGFVPNDTLAMLISGGEYYLNIAQNGTNVLAPNGVAVTLPADNTGGTLPGMSQFDGVAVGDDLNWAVNLLGTVQTVTDIDGNEHYLIMDKIWGWTNVAQFHASGGPYEMVRASMPTGFTPSNCELFISYDGQGMNLASLDGLSGTYFTETYLHVPIGQPVHFIALAYIDGELYYAVQESVIEEDHIETIPIAEFHATTRAQVETIINDLP